MTQDISSGSRTMNSALIIIPTYDEKENVGAIAKAILDINPGVNLLFVDANSPDGTGTILDGMVAADPRIFVIHQPGKSGLGRAYIEGFEWALRRPYEFIFEMDADFSHNPADLERLYDACKNGGADVSIGSRYVPGGKTENWPLDRQLYSKGGAFYTKIITWMPVNDPTAGFVCYKRKVLESLNFNRILFVGYAFQIEMKFAAWKLGFIIKEVPITFIDRKIGVSKMSKGIIKEGVLGVLSMQWKSLFGNYRKKIRNSA